MRRYYDEIGVSPVYSTEGVLENVYDDRELEEDDTADLSTWESLKEQLGGDPE